MPDFDYTELANDAFTLVSDFGRDVTLVQLDTTVDDPEMEWRGNSKPRLTPAATTTQRAVNAEPSSLQLLGLEAVAEDLLRRTNKIVMLGGATELAQYNEVIDGGQRFNILWRRELRPANVLLLTFMGLTR